MVTNMVEAQLQGLELVYEDYVDSVKDMARELAGELSLYVKGRALRIVQTVRNR